MRENRHSHDPDRGVPGDEPEEAGADDVLDTSPYDSVGPQDTAAADPATADGTQIDPGYDAAPTPGSAALFGGGEPREHDEPSTDDRRRRRWLLPTIIVVLVLVAAGAAVYFFLLDREDAESDAEPSPLSETTEATDPPTEDDPAEAGEDAGEDAGEGATAEEPAEEETEEVPEQPGELESQLEDSIDAGETTFEVTDDGFVVDDDAIEEGALEAYAATYAAGDVELEFLATRWSDNDLADEYAESLTEALEGADEVETGSTYIDGSGTYWAFVLEEDRAAIIWTTDRGHVFQVVGGIDYVGPFYSGYPI
ncbi:MAG TPA: hypothetical protein VK024_08485 [Actinomycetaceae bacterium]|nr:hypothetical protein [Actinomycetaceae bacterium]